MTMKNFFDLAKYAHTGIASPGMTAYEKQRALSAFGGFPIASITGVDEIQFDSGGKPLISWYINGNEVQNGTPAPDDIIMPSETGDKTANLVRVANDNYIAYSTYTAFSIVDDTVVTSGNVLIGFLAKVEPNTDYAVAFDNTSGYAHLRIRTYSAKPDSWSDASFIDQPVNIQGSAVYKSGTFTTTSETEWVLVCMYVPSTSSGTVVSNIMLNTGSTALDYEPYGYKIDISCGGTQTVYLQEPIRKIDDSADVASAVGTVGTATRAIYKVVFTGGEDETWSKRTSPDNTYMFNLNPSGFPAGIGGTVAISSHFTSNYRVSYLTSGQLYIGGTTMSFRNDDCEDLTAWRNFLSTQYAAGTPVCVWYMIQEPQTETFTAPTITPQKGANTLTVETELQPSEVSVTGKIEPVTE